MSSFSDNAAANEQRDNMKVGLALVGIVIAFLFSLVVIKTFCNIMIDIVVVRDGYSLMRTLSELRRLLFPNWHPRTEPSSPQEQDGRNVTNQSRIGMGTPIERGFIDMDNLLMGMTAHQKKDLIAAILTSKAATKSDIVSWKISTCPSMHSVADGSVENAEPDNGDLKKQNEPTSSLLCPICIHEISLGESICYSGLCHHVFHKDCLSAWLSTHSRICPYCRQEIVTQEMLEEAHRIKLEWLENGESDSDDEVDQCDDSLSSDSSSTSTGC
jgi:hypothetical protein